MDRNDVVAILWLGEVANLDTRLLTDKEGALNLLRSFGDSIRHFTEKSHAKHITSFHDSGLLFSFKSSRAAATCALQLLDALQDKLDLSLPILIDLQPVPLIGSILPQIKDVEALKHESRIFVTQAVYREIQHDANFIATEAEVGNGHSPLFSLSRVLPNEPDVADAKLKVKYPIFQVLRWAIPIGLLTLVFFFISSQRRTKNVEQAPQSMEVVRDHSIAVLPFENLGTPETEGFATGVIEDILTNLSRSADLRVISRTSTAQYKDTKKSIPVIAAELGVGYILEGSVRESNGKIRISAQLIGAADDRHIWAATYDREEEDIFLVQREVSQEIVKALNETFRSEIKLKNKVSTDNLEAYRIYLEGRHLLLDRSEPSILASIERFDQALKLDANFADAMAEKAAAISHLGSLRYRSEDESYALSETLALKAIQIDPENAGAYNTLASIYNNQEKWTQASAAFEIALKLNPNRALTHYWYSLLLRSLCRFEEAASHSGQAVELDPLHPIINQGHAINLAHAGRIDEASASFARSKLLFPNNFVYHWAHGMFKVIEAKYDTALINLERARSMNNQVKSIDRSIVYCQGKIGDFEAVQGFIRNHQEGTQLDHLALAVASAGLSDVEACLSHLEAMQSLGRLPSEIMAMVEYRFLHAEPRFAKIIKNMGLDINDSPTKKILPK